MSTEKAKKPMQTKNKILIAAASIIVIAGIAVGIYFGVRKNDNANGSSSNSTGESSSSSSSAVPSGTTSAAPQPTGVLPVQNGTMVNGTLLPYYTLTGPVPAPKATAGTVYTNCVEPGTYSISYDDGPSAYTHSLLDLLDKEEIKVTFFVNGDNDGCIYDPTVRSVIKRAYESGHQIASHTWSHPQLTTLSVEQITLQMTRVEQALLDILGIVPRYMRPPYGDGTFGNGNANDVKVQTTLKNMGYVIATWDIATTDADIDDNNAVHKLTDDALAKVEQGVVTSSVSAAPVGANHMQLMHDTYQRTVTQLSPWSITYIKGLNYKIVPVAVCLGDSDPRNWYQTITTPSANPPTTCTK
ncbi:Carbohydrate esterase 4 protein [Mortierella hygrophila]|uniref:Carbohydrate esterase 4 protein n=1 Tax=Mortierella hygrophila TaxID=979708 RepID=A0A9P6K934_9FUNG|nr:Carbohydrate esterase 4 protein [Mortierella hygrophila]